VKLLVGVLMRSSRAMMVLASLSLSCVMEYFSVLIVQMNVHAVSCAACIMYFRCLFNTLNNLRPYDYNYYFSFCINRNISINDAYFFQM